MNDPEEEIKTFVYGFFHKERPDFLGQGFWTVAIFMDKTIHISRQESQNSRFFYSHTPVINDPISAQKTRFFYSQGMNEFK